MTEKQDTILIAEAQANPASFEQLYNKYAARIFNYFWYRVGHDRDIAEDLMQKTFIRAFKALPQYQQRGYSYHTYLRTIAHNVLVSYYRSPKAMPLDEAINIPDEPIRDITNKIDARLVWDAVRDNLSPSEKNIILLRYQKNLPIKDIAKIVSKSENAVKLQLSRARKKLQKDIRLTSLHEFQDVVHTYTSPRFIKKIS